MQAPSVHDLLDVSTGDDDTTAGRVRVPGGMAVHWNLGPSARLVDVHLVQATVRRVFVAAARFQTAASVDLWTQYSEDAERASQDPWSAITAPAQLVRSPTRVESAIVVERTIFANPWDEILGVGLSLPAIAGAAWGGLRLSKALLDVYVRIRALPDELDARRAAFRAEIAKSKADEAESIAALADTTSSDRPVSREADPAAVAASNLMAALLLVPPAFERLRVTEVSEAEVSAARTATRAALETEDDE